MLTLWLKGRSMREQQPEQGELAQHVVGRMQPKKPHIWQKSPHFSISAGEEREIDRER
jgi:hypothetical protein